MTSHQRSIQCGNGEAKVFDVKCDESEVVVSLENGTIEVYDKDDLSLRHFCAGQLTHGVHLGLHRRYIVTGFFDKVVDVWIRPMGDTDDLMDTNGDIIKVQRVELESSVYVVKVMTIARVFLCWNRNKIILKIGGKEVPPIFFVIVHSVGFKRKFSIETFFPAQVTSDYALASLVNGSVIVFNVTGDEKSPLKWHFTIEGNYQFCHLPRSLV